MAKRTKRQDQPIQKIARWVAALLAQATRTVWEDQKIENYRLHLVAREQRVFKQVNPTALHTNRAALRRRGFKILTRGAFGSKKYEWSKPNPFVVSYAKQQASGHSRPYTK